jgi:hypothetical protein
MSAVYNEVSILTIKEDKLAYVEKSVLDYSKYDKYSGQRCAVSAVIVEIRTSMRLRR